MWILPLALAPLASNPGTPIHAVPGTPGIARADEPEWFAGPTNVSIDASSEMWAFFREHPLSQ